MIEYRQRNYSWEDPLKGINQAKNITGLEYLKGIFAGSIAAPPIFNTVDFKVISVEKGQVIFEFHPKEFHYNPVGSVHGGIVTTILDSAIGCSLLSTLPVKTTFTTLDLKINFVAKINTKTPVLKTHTKIIHQGKTTALLEADLIDNNGKVYAHTVSTCMILPI
ncbi:PaaI family thioesterase [Flavobacterium sediminis]|uniref:PaaI family thioesterase n=1 Tax=Flavobacterium sediminis TaxID=2201181 RepID=A0A2U8QY38_9FLAO|nr:PaaI family thioesterase [Flavobacterium sediminis]AWM14826.1 PaaI family thioesterase [Flavobacterium sediminis]